MMPDDMQAAPRPADAPAHTAHLAATLPLGRRTRIMDVGANPANVPPYAALRDAGLCEVHGFEPGEEAFARLQAAARPNETNHPHAVGLGGAAAFHATRGASFASLYPPSGRQIDALGHWEAALTVERVIPMETRALDGIAGLPRPDMLKMDTQGAELDILDGGRETLSEAVVVMPEVRFYKLYEGEPMLHAVDARLREMGFMLHKILPGATLRLTSSRIDRLKPAMTRNQMIDADAVYVRDIAYPERMSEAQIAHLALLADATFASMDLVLRCLDLLALRGAWDHADTDAYIDRLPPAYRKPA
jgi:FkbM family methyltransferase